MHITRIGWQRASVVAVATLICVGLGGSARGQSPPIVHELPSVVLQDTRVVRVVLPPHYALSGRRYPVVYVLDGDSALARIADAATILSGAGRIPEAIIVGLSHRRRSWELTMAPAATWTYPPSLGEVGGADRFLDAMAADIVPWIDRTYRTQTHRTLVGHSLGGLLAWHALATRPGLFQAYVIVDASVFWNHGQVVDEVEKAVRSSRPPKARVFWVRDQIPHEVWFPENVRLKALVDAAPSPVTRITFLELPDESHATVVYPGAYLGLKAVFDDYRLPNRPDWTMTQVEAWYTRLGEEWGYPVAVPRGALSAVAHHLEQAGHPDAALDVFQRGIEQYPESLAARDDLAEALTRAGRAGQARQVRLDAVALAERLGSSDLPQRRAALAPVR